MKNFHSHRRPSWALLAISILGLILVTAACGDGGDTSADENGADENGTDQGASDGTSLSLAGTWELVSVDVDDESIPLPDRPLTITIAAGQIDGDAGCNSFSGSIDRGDTGSLSLGPLVQTEMACDDLDFEVTYMGALSGVNAWESSPDGIAFVSERARVIYRPQQAEPLAAAPLVGTTWLLDSVYGPGEGPERAVSTVDMSAPSVTMVVDATTATLRSESCTDTVYEIIFEESNGGGPFEVQGGGEVECQGSESGNVNHETASGALTGTSGYMLDGNRLILIGEEGELVAFVAQTNE